MKIEKFEDLDILKDARVLSKDVFKITSLEPFCNDYRFKDQLKASSGSVMDNIAEGFERDGTKEFIQFLSIAKGSCGEVRSQLYRAYDYNYIDENVLNIMVDRSVSLSKRISKFISYLKKSDIKGRKYS